MRRHSPYSLALVDMLRDFDMDDEEIVEKLVEYDTPEDEARAIVAAAGVPA